MSSACDSVAGLAPVGEQYRHVGQHVSQRAQLPVQDGPHVAVTPHDAVVQPVVAVHDAGGGLFGDAGRQMVVDRTDVGTLGAGCGLDLPQPAPELPSHVALPPAQIAQPDRVDVDAVQAGQHVGEGAAEHPPGRDLQGASSLVGVADDQPVHVVHDVEGGAVHVRVGAEPEWPRDGESHRMQGGDRQVLAAHVMGSGQHVVQRWPAEHPAPPRVVGDHEGHVGVTRLDQGERQGWAGGADRFGEPGRHGRGVDTCRHNSGGGGVAHVVAVTLLRAHAAARFRGG